MPKLLAPIPGSLATRATATTTIDPESSPHHEAPFDRESSPGPAGPSSRPSRHRTIRGTARCVMTTLKIGIWLCVAASAAATLQACQDEQGLSSQVQPQDPDGCASNDQCSTPTAVCDATVCVQCTTEQASACTGLIPVCGDDHTCQACAAHSDCSDSHVCMPDGSCAAAPDVAYVDPAGTDNALCTKDTPCTKVSKALATNKPYVKFTGTTDEAVTVDGGTRTFLADPGAKITATGDTILRVKNDAHLAIYDLELTGGAAGIIAFDPQVIIDLERVRLTHNGSGIDASRATFHIADSTISDNLRFGIVGGGIVTIVRSTIADNLGTGIFSPDTLTISQSTISGNQGGGLSFGGADFDVTNNVIVGNGSLTSYFGGVELGNTGDGGRFEFNTVIDNLASASSAPGVSCTAATAPVTFSNNIIYGNRGGTHGDQVTENAGCAWTYSDIGPKAVSGTGNINATPSFVSPLQHDYHLKPDSPGKDLADPAATLDGDFDGDARPQGGRRDIGADEIAP